MRNTLWVGGAQGVQMAAAFVFMPLLIGAFGVVNYGVYLLMSSMANYATVLDFGLSASLIRLVADSRARDDREALRDAVRSSLLYYAGVGFIVAAALALLGLFGLGVFRLSADELRIARNLLLIAAAASVLIWPLSTFTYLLAGAQRHDTVARIQALGTVANVSATAGVLLLDEGPVALMAATMLVSIAMGMVALLMARRELGADAFRLRRRSRGGVRRLMRHSWPISVVQLCSLLLYQQTDRVVLGVFLGSASISLYEAAAKLQNLVIQLVGTSSTAVLPAAAHLDAQERRSEMQTLFLRGSKYTGIFLAPVIVTLLVLAEPLLRSWLGDAFAAQALVAQVLLAHWLLTSITAVGSNIVLGSGQVQKRLPTLIAATFANVGLSVLLVQRYGILGVALGTTIALAVDFPVNMRFLLRTVGVPGRRFVTDVMLRVYPLLALPAALGLTAVWLGLTGSLLGVAVTAAVCVGAYWLMSYAVSFSAKERGEVKSLVQLVARKVGLGS